MMFMRLFSLHLPPVPVLRTSGEAELRSSRLWQRSPSRPVRDEAFSSPSSTTTTQAPVDAPPTGTRNPETDTSRQPSIQRRVPEGSTNVPPSPRQQTPPLCRCQGGAGADNGVTNVFFLLVSQWISVYFTNKHDFTHVSLISHRI